MPIVVRELIIRARVEETRQSPAGNGTLSRKRRPLPNDAEIEQIVSLCVEKVMENLERQKER